PAVGRVVEVDDRRADPARTACRVVDRQRFDAHSGRGDLSARGVRVPDAWRLARSDVRGVDTRRDRHLVAVDGGDGHDLGLAVPDLRAFPRPTDPFDAGKTVAHRYATCVGAVVGLGQHDVHSRSEPGTVGDRDDLGALRITAGPIHDRGGAILAAAETHHADEAPMPVAVISAREGKKRLVWTGA